MAEVSRKEVNDKVQDLLNEVVEFPVHMVYAPEDQEPGYVMLYPLPSPTTSGDYGDPQRDRWHLFQVRSVGETVDQATLLSDRVYSALCERAVGGDSFAHSLVLDGAYVVERRCDSRGAILLGEGDQIFQVDDSYRILIGGTT
jgi:hypothetical protein